MSLPEMSPVADAEHLHPRLLAYLGDAVYELFIREQALKRGIHRWEDAHAYATTHVNGAFQAGLLDKLEPLLSDSEKEWVRRGRNAPVAASRRSDQAVHRRASGLETLIGYLYLKDPSRLQVLWTGIAEVLQP